MNILYLMNHAGKGGSEKYVHVLAKHLKRKKDSIFFYYNEDGPLAGKMKTISDAIGQLDMNSPADLEASAKLCAICKRHKIDIIHTQFARENYVAVFSRKFFGNKAKVIHTCHINTENNVVWRIANKIFMGGNSAVIAVCNSVREKLIKNGYPEEKISLVYNGIDYKETVHKNDNLRKELKLGCEKFIFISLTRFSGEKGIDFLLEGAKILKSRNPNFALILAGDGELIPMAKAFVKENGLSDTVFFLGYRSDSENLLMGSDCFINSSSTEALSFAILEGLGAGLPVIATKVGGTPDIINNRTDCGALVDYGNSKMLADAMEGFLTNRNLARELGENGRKAIRDIFNTQEMLNATYDIYLNSIGGKHDN